MRKIIASLAILFSLAACSLPQPATTFDPLAPLVRVSGENGGKGSAFAVAPHLLLTNAHVAAAAKNDEQVVNLELYDGTKFSGTVVWEGVAELYDIALISTDIELGNIAEIDCARAEPGDPVVIAGHPGSSNWALTFGYVSSTWKLQGSEPEYITVDATVIPGSSGGPVYNRNTGKVIGMSTAVMAQPIPYAYMSQMVDIGLMLDSPTICKALGRE